VRIFNFDTFPSIQILFRFTIISSLLVYIIIKYFVFSTVFFFFLSSIIYKNKLVIDKFNDFTYLCDEIIFDTKYEVDYRRFDADQCWALHPTSCCTASNRIILKFVFRATDL
jgi:hypothetical protein